MMRLMTVTTEVNYFRMTLASIAKVVMKVFIKKIFNNTSQENEKKPRYNTRSCGFISKLCLLYFFEILSILLQMLPMRLSGGTGVFISLTMYTSVCELMMVPRQ